MKKDITLASPWIIYYNKIKAMFQEDPDVKIVFNEKNYIIKLYVENTEKAEAISLLLPETVNFGNITVHINVIPGNRFKCADVDIFRKAFEGNPAVVNISTIDTPVGDESFVIFKNKVVQYHNDDMWDYHGICSTLYQDLAKELFGDFMTIHFCTDVVDENKQ